MSGNKKQKNISVMQTSESFLLSALLSFSGGLQDAYTFNLRDNVFANAQTGNVVLMSQNFMTGKYMTGLRYICPLIAFVLGIFIADVVENKYKHSKKLHWRQMILVMEMISLSIVGMIPFSMNMVANMIVSFSCAMQVQTFRTVRGYGYASTMCIGNLRSGTVSLSEYLRNKNKASLRKAGYFFGIIFIFALGAGFGGVVSIRMGNGTICFSVAILLAVMMMMNKKQREYVEY